MIERYEDTEGGVQLQRDLDVPVPRPLPGTINRVHIAE
jgi:hypothetical protein